MNLCWKTDDLRAERRGRRAIWHVESLETRDLMALVVSTITQPIVVGTPSPTLTVATFNLGDVSAIAQGNFAALIDWGDGTNTVGAVVEAGSGFEVQGSHTYAFATPLGKPDILSVTVTNHDATTNAIAGPASGPINVLPAGVVLSPASFSETKGVTFTHNVATFTDANPAALSGFVAATINWGDGTAATSGTVGSISSGVFGVLGTHTYGAGSTYTTTITVYDLVGTSIVQSTIGTGQVTVPTTIPSISPISHLVLTPANQPIEPPTVIGSFLYTPPSTASPAPMFSAVINWGDGHISQGTVLPDLIVANKYDVFGSNTYTVAGNYSVVISVADQLGNSNTITSSATVIGSSPIVVIPTTFAVNPDTPFAGIIATFIDPNPAAMTGTPTALIDWGNGTISAGTVTGPDTNGVFTVRGSISYLSTSTTGKYPVTVTITDVNGRTGSAVSTAVMNTPTPVPTLTGGFDLGGENGPSAALGYAATNRPTFGGTTSPFALVQLYARRTDVDATLSLGQTVAGANGTWSLGVGPLSEGIFAISAIVTPAGGSPTGPLPLVSGTFGPIPNSFPVGGNTGLFAIDTTPPQLVRVYSDGQGNVLVQFQDSLSGLSLPTLEQTATYSFTDPNGSTFHPVKATPLPNAGLPTDIETVELTLGVKSKSLPKTLRITAAGILDNAGNPLAANYHGGIASASYLAKSSPVVKLHSPKPKHPRR